MKNIVKTVAARILLFALILVIVLPATPVKATPASISMDVTWGTWPFCHSVTITSDTYANPTMTATWSGGQPFFGLIVGGHWDVVAGNGTEFEINSENFRVTSNSPNLSYEITMDKADPEIGSIGEKGHEFEPFRLIPQTPVVVTIGK
jgi:hypothetical protein